MENVVAGLSAIDYVIFGIYAIVVIAIGLFASKKNTKSAEGHIVFISLLFVLCACNALEKFKVS